MRRLETWSTAALVRSHRDRIGLTQEALAERAGLSYRSVSDIERGVSRTPYQATLQRLADALKLDEDDRAHLLASARSDTNNDSVPSGRAALPAETFALVGRERDEAEALHLLRFENVRLLTLTGPGGVGKTRLALHLGHVLAPDFADTRAVWLASTTDPNVVPSVVAGALDLAIGSAAETEHRILAYLSRGRTLLIVDNLEQVLPAAPLLGRLLQHSPNLCVIATSRSPLRLRDEHELVVAPLALPNPRSLPDLDALRRYPAVDLFIRRLRAVRPQFQLTETNASNIAEICVRLEGLPLALELAAARIRVLSPTELLLRLSHPLQTLTGGSVDLPPRQQTMRAAITWSYDLLSPELQAFFRRFAVFSGGADMAAIERVVAGGATLELLTGLVEASLIQTAETKTGNTRYFMLETLRELALEALAMDSDEQQVRGRHAEFCAWLSKTSEHELGVAGQAAWLARMEQEHDNVRAAIEWAQRTGRIALGLRVAYPMWRFWSHRGYLDEGRARLSSLLSANDDTVPPDTRAAGLYALGALAQAAGDHAAARESWLRCLEIDRVHADAGALASTLNALGTTSIEVCAYAEAEEYLEEAMRLYREIGRGSGVSTVLHNRGTIARYQGRYEDALAHFQGALEECRSRGVPSDVVLENIALVHLDLGRYKDAIGALDLSIEQGRETDNILVEVGALATLALVYAESGELERGRSLGRDAAARARDLGRSQDVARALNVEARSAAALGDTDVALILAREALEIIRRSGAPRMHADELLGLGFVHLQRGELGEAQRYIEEALALARDSAWILQVAQALEQRAHIARLQSNHTLAVRSHGEAAAIRESLGTPVHRIHQRTYAVDLEVARDVLSAEIFAAAWDEGRQRALATMDNRLCTRA